MKKNLTKICASLQELHKRYPTQNIGRHLELALSDYPSLFSISDKEMVYALEKYILAIEIDPIASTAEVERILEEGMNLDTLFSDEEDF